MGQLKMVAKEESVKSVSADSAGIISRLIKI